MATTSTGRRTAGLFDIRTVIGGLLGVYGLVLTLMGVFGDLEESKTGSINANLWAGLGLLVGGLIFLAWAWLRPVTVPAEKPHPEPAER